MSELRMEIQGTPTDGSWVRLERGSDWGAEYFSLPGQTLMNGACSKHHRGIPFKDGAPIHVRWPDGTVTKEVVKHEKLNGSNDDHGKESHFTYELAGFMVDTRGLKHWLALDGYQGDGRYKAALIEVWVGPDFPAARGGDWC